MMSEEMDVSVRNEENMDGAEGGGDEQEMTEEMRKKKEMMVEHFKEKIFGTVQVKGLKMLRGRKVRNATSQDLGKETDIVGEILENGDQEIKIAKVGGLTGGIRRMEQIRKEDLESKGMEISVCGKFLKMKSEEDKNPAHLSRESIGYGFFRNREAIHQGKTISLQEDFIAGKNPHINLETLMAKIKEAEEKIKGGKVLEQEGQLAMVQETIVQEADSRNTCNLEFADPNNGPIHPYFDRNSRARTGVLGTKPKAKRKKPMKSSEQIHLAGGRMGEKSPKQSRISESLNNLSNLTKTPKTPEFESPMNEYHEDSLNLTIQTPGNQNGVLFMDESKVKGMLDDHSRSMRKGIELQARKTQEELGKQFNEALGKQNESIEIVFSNMSNQLHAQFHNQTQNIFDKFEQSLNGAMARLTTKEEELVREIDEKFEQITEQQTEIEAKVVAVEERVEQAEQRMQQNRSHAEQQLGAVARTLEGRMENAETDMENLGLRMTDIHQEVLGRINGLSESVMEQVEVATEAHFDSRASRIGDLIAASRLSNSDIDNRVQRAVENVIQERGLGSGNLAAVNANLLSRISALEDQNREHNRLTKAELERIREEMKRIQIKEDNYWINSIKIHGLREAREADAPRSYARKELDRFEISHLVEEAEHVLVGEDRKSLRLSFRNFTEFRKAFSELAAAGRRHGGSLRFNQLIPKRFGSKYEKMRNIGKEKVQNGEAVRFFFLVKDQNLGIKVYRTHRSVPEIILWEREEENSEELPAEERLCRICLMELGGSCQRLKCGHAFHTRCIEIWLAGRPGCPVCREEVVRGPQSQTGPSDIKCTHCLHVMDDPALAIFEEDYYVVLAVGCHHAHYKKCYRTYLSLETADAAEFAGEMDAQRHSFALSMTEPKCRLCRDEDQEVRENSRVNIGPQENGHVPEFIHPTEQRQEEGPVQGGEERQEEEMVGGQARGEEEAVERPGVLVAEERRRRNSRRSPLRRREEERRSGPVSARRERRPGGEREDRRRHDSAPARREMERGRERETGRGREAGWSGDRRREINRGRNADWRGDRSGDRRRGESGGRGELDRRGESGRRERERRGVSWGREPQGGSDLRVSRHVRQYGQGDRMNRR